ncbi:type VI secretion system baseplate subunit TssF [Elizabethkingia sp. HX XZB]|uniref:type VI secretion system baseplate subunit TssF n=1 Tax=Elizabethkingia sp. HX XZB TaxID=3003193 RepID=UPI002A248799|nr:type VI secretion system baseplate subunit TssF [Elizabethkingia sp. HX XZB]MDX8568264.1 type VI secretion system baseplate subunit TssF [Elizabethkingia sp. HX XZB]
MHLDQNIYSKETIKARMLQNATKLWGVKSIQSLDPFVKLLIDAFSTEVFKANNEIQNVNSRLLERLARMLTPTKYTHPVPAHAIAFYTPEEDVEYVMDYTEFFFKKSINSFSKTQSDKQVDVPFTPVDNIRTIKAQVGAMIVGNTCYAFDENLNRTPICRINNRIEDYRKISIGINVSKYSAGRLPEKLSLFCANTAFEHIDYVYRLLPHVKVTSNGKVLSINPGLSYTDQRKYEGFEEVFKEQSIRYKVTEDIKKIYNSKFIEVEGIHDDLKLQPGYFPFELGYLKGQAPALDQLIHDNSFLWLTFEFPPQFTDQILDNFSFALNAFPVYNRGWKKTEYILDIMGNNIPLETGVGEYFLYVEEVVDGEGKKYEEIPFTPNDHLSKGLYTVRKGGMERFSNRNAVDLMVNVLELTRDEVAAFSVFNRDKLRDLLGEMSDKMKGMIKKVENADKDLVEDVNYVIIEPIESSVHTYAAFWITHCALANHIRPGTTLNSQQKAKSIILLTESTGGDLEQKGSDSIQAYRYALMTRDKIVSIEDIKAYCQMVMKDELKSIKVSRGTIISDKPKEGFVKTIDISIVAQNYAFYGKSYWDNQATVLMNNIKVRAIDGVIYRVKIEEGSAVEI